MKKQINIIGAGLAGCEAANFLANHGYKVNLYEMRPQKSTGAHHTSLCGELVCSNSLKSKALDNACGLLKKEIEVLGSLIMECAYKNEVPSGNALSVDRDGFAKYIDNKIKQNKNITLINEEVKEFKEDEIYIVASGPLTSNSLIQTISNLTNQENLFFFDASAPLILKDSIDMNIAYKKSRYEQGDDSYINCAFNKEEYLSFYNELINAKLAYIHDFDKNYFEGCMPVEVLAKRGVDTLRFGPLKPRGLETEKYPHPYAVVQLRQDNAIGSLYNIVGFQTNLTYSEQKRVFSMIPGLKNAEFVRYGLMHRNSYINAPALLNIDLSLNTNENIVFAGQLCGVEGYVESAASGLYAAIELYLKLENRSLEFPKNTMLYSLISYITNKENKKFSPMNANYGIMYGVNKKNKIEKGEESLNSIKNFVQNL